MKLIPCSKTGIHEVIDIIIASDRPRSVFFCKGRLLTCPSGGTRERLYLSKDDHKLIGVYDSGADERMLQSDIEAIQ